jgi:Zn-dependent M28 family amino/carboxypeptidase
MGSSVYARRAAERGDRIVAMLSVDSIGYFSDNPESQAYPEPLAGRYPTTGNFVAVLGNARSSQLVSKLVTALIEHGSMPVHGAAAADDVEGVAASDHWSFWQMGYPAVVITDTAAFRSPHYRRPTDTADKLDFERMARVVAALERAVADLVGMGPQKQ